MASAARRVSLTLFAPLVAGALLAACQHTPQSPSAAPAASAKPAAAKPLNKDFGSCRYRRCDFGK